MNFRRQKSREVINISSLPRFLEKIQIDTENRELSEPFIDQYLLFKNNFAKTLPSYQKIHFYSVLDDFRLDNTKVIPFTLEQLIILNNIVRFGTFKNAAEKLYMSQAAISLQIKRLENKLNISLFERTNKNLRLTLSGSILLYYIDRILFLCDEVSKLIISSNILKKEFSQEKYSNYELNNPRLSKQKSKDVDLLKFKSIIFSKDYIKCSFQRKKTNLILRQVRQFLHLKKEFDLVSFTLGNFTFLVKKDFEIRFLRLLQFQVNEENINILYLTDELLFPSTNLLETNTPFNYFKIFEKNHSIEVNSIEAFVFCLKTELGGCFFFDNSVLKSI